MRAQITKVEDHRRLVTELSRHLTSLKKSHAVGKQEEKNLIESWTQYADKLAKDADCPELGIVVSFFYYYFWMANNGGRV